MDSARGAAQAERSANQVACLRYLADADEARTVGAISEGTGLSRPTVHAVLDDLLETGLVEAASPATAGPGRPARAFRFARETGLVAGVDLGPRGARAIICDLSGRRLGYAELAPERKADLSLIPRALDAAAGSTDLARAGRSIDLGRLRAVGVGLPGVVEADGRLRASLAMPDLVGVPVAELLAKELEQPIVVDNDIKLAALAEQRGGAGRGYSDVVYLQIGHRLSVSIVLNGVIRQGRHRLAGELGAQRGMRWTRNAQRGQLVWSVRPTSAEVLSAAAAGDADAQAEVEDFCAQIAGRIATVLLVVDPEVVVVRGGALQDSGALLRPLTAAVEQELVFPERPPFVASALGREAVVLGAVGNAFDRCSSGIYGVHDYPSPWAHITHELERTTQ
ncbi:putative NBD/HSP70 family sugar kinase [Kribbella sp. VKM Ac-2571]|uniref:ROK family transcriptional regulator n=1 Tax=Kribbella sp. VKM Ac-2571 TaxID=2512222 RepID=UPI00105C6004|nr:ROK family transcriptional regulator [Kribbella sp. VKM Ac-2571]TDO51211.1 putative NBD/HSP70 family sugar kinase [Kribbella sp. VKM Ac-2571]